jgi:zinc/manganese transport system ATP-binding protein
LKFGYLPQITDFDRDFPITVEQTIAMGAMGKKTGDIRLKIAAALRDVGLDHIQKRLIGDLSAGQLKRVLFARLIVQDADIICLDEPFAEIDEQSTAMLMRHLLTWKQSGKTIMVVLHNLEMAKQYFDHAIILSSEHGHKCGTTLSLLPEIIAMSARYGD